MKTKPELNSSQKTLLVFLGAGETQELDPIRIMKGLFLFGKEGPDEWFPPEARYQFEPYDYGPCSFQIYSDLDQLTECGYVRSTEVPGRSWKYYSLTPDGLELYRCLAKTMNPGAVRYLQAVRDFVSKLSFYQLLAVVYHRYPEYAVNSVFKF